MNVPVNNDPTDLGCFHEDSLIFVQVGCMVPNETLASKRKHALCLCCVAVFIALFAINFIDFVKKKEENSYVEWDIKSITAGDYTIEFDLVAPFY